MFERALSVGVRESPWYPRPSLVAPQTPHDCQCQCSLRNIETIHLNQRIVKLPYVVLSLATAWLQNESRNQPYQSTNHCKGEQSTKKFCCPRRWQRRKFPAHLLETFHKPQLLTVVIRRLGGSDFHRVSCVIRRPLLVDVISQLLKVIPTLPYFSISHFTLPVKEPWIQWPPLSPLSSLASSVSTCLGFQNRSKSSPQGLYRRMCARRARIEDIHRAVISARDPIPSDDVLVAIVVQCLHIALYRTRLVTARLQCFGDTNPSPSSLLRREPLDTFRESTPVGTVLVDLDFNECSYGVLPRCEATLLVTVPWVRERSRFGNRDQHKALAALAPPLSP